MRSVRNSSAYAAVPCAAHGNEPIFIEMALLYLEDQPLSVYRDRLSKVDEEIRQKALAITTTLYVGNLSFYTTEEQIYEVFSKCGEVRRVIMGLDKLQKTPCGFCFVEFYSRADTEDAVRFINGTRVDDRVIRTDFDPGFVEGRQWGRGKHGGQVRELYRTDYDPGRGGYGVQAQEALARQSGSPAVPIAGPRGERKRGAEEELKQDAKRVHETNPRFRESGENEEEEEEGDDGEHRDRRVKR